MKIALLLDNPRSWIVPYAKELMQVLEERGHSVSWHERAEDMEQGDCAFFLSCEKIVPPALLALHAHNLVVHESALPQGKGFSPLTWQILEGKHDIAVTLFEAAEGLDCGDIFGQEMMHFDGSELIHELRQKQGEATIRLILAFVDAYPPGPGKLQEGEESFYPRRTPKDSELDPDQTLAQVFDRLRVADNERYPAFFTHRGHTYILKIYKKD